MTRRGLLRVVALGGLLAPASVGAQECPLDEPRGTEVWSRFVRAARQLYEGAELYDTSPASALDPTLMGHALGRAALQVGDDPDRRTAYACLEEGVQLQLADHAYLYESYGTVERGAELVHGVAARLWQRTLEAAMGMHDDSIRRRFHVGPDDAMGPIFDRRIPDPTAGSNADGDASIRCRVVQEPDNPNAVHAGPDDDDFRVMLTEGWTHIVDPAPGGGFSVHVVQQPRSHPDSLRFQAMRQRETEWRRAQGQGVMADMVPSAATRERATRSAECFCRRRRGAPCDDGDEAGHGTPLLAELTARAHAPEPSSVDPGAAAARIRATAGDVRIRAADGREREACGGCTIYPGETLVTGPSARAKIAWSDPHGFDLRDPIAVDVWPSTELEITAVRHPELPCDERGWCPVYTRHGLDRRLDPSFTSLTIGRIRAVARIRGEVGYKALVGPAVVTFEGTDLVVARDSTDAIEVLVGDGAVTVEAGGASTRVAAGERLVVRDGAPGPVAAFASGAYPVAPTGSGADASAPPSATGGGGPGGGGGGTRSPGFRAGSVLLGALGLLVLGLLVALVAIRARAVRRPRGAIGTRVEVSLTIRGPGAAEGRAVRFDRTPIRIGRDPSNDLVLDDPVVSRQHAEIVLRDGRLRLLDRDGSTGTLVEDTPVRDTELVSGATIRMGDTTLEVG